MYKDNAYYKQSSTFRCFEYNSAELLPSSVVACTQIHVPVKRLWRPPAFVVIAVTALRADATIVDAPAAAMSSPVVFDSAIASSDNATISNHVTIVTSIASLATTVAKHDGNN